MSLIRTLQEKGLFQLLAIILIVVFFFMLSEILKPDESDSGSKRLTPGADVSDTVADVRAIKAQSVEWFPELVLNGVVESTAEIDIAPLVSGKVIAVSEGFREGSSIARGDLLFRIDPADYELALEATLAELAAAKSDLLLTEAQAEIAVKEWKTLFPGVEITDLGARRPQVAAAKARLESAEAARKKAELDLERTRIAAPFDGRIVEAGLDAGQVVMANQSVGRAFNSNRTEIVAPVRREELAGLSPVAGARVKLVDPSNGELVGEGTIARSGSVLDRKSRMATIYIRPDNPAIMVPGTFLKILARHSVPAEAWRVPATTLDDHGRIWATHDGRLVLQKITVLESAGDERIIADLPAGLTLVEPATVASEGQKARIISSVAMKDKE